MAKNFFQINETTDPIPENSSRINNRKLYNNFKTHFTLLQIKNKEKIMKTEKKNTEERKMMCQGINLRLSKTYQKSCKPEYNGITSLEC